MKLAPWVVRALIPAGLIGTYMLYRNARPVYVGRSDSDLRQRLLRHAGNRRGEHFTYDVHFTPLQAFEVECSLFHTLRAQIENVIHPDQPDHMSARCPFCHSTLVETLAARLHSIRP
ncbi:GIY-YIG nuclease family protein [Nonomuraea sp. NPDC001831]|uniref:GIY-YIG nuclease family protein n=1 Tax=Nonomuraea sp. NPDC001831 TaxID=3364340 RepID=UPI003682B43B